MTIIHNDYYDKETHNLVYKSESIPIKSAYFINYPAFKLNDGKNIQLIKNKELENILNISNDTVLDMKNFIQNESIAINDKNVCELYYLSDLYKVNNLAEKAFDYISENLNELALDHLFFVQYSDDYKNIDSSIKHVANNFHVYIQNEKIFKLKVHIIDLIMNEYYKNKKSFGKNDQRIMDFLFKCIDEKYYGKEGSLLFKYAKNEQPNAEYLDLLLNEPYNSTFDYKFVATELKESYHKKIETTLEQKDEINNLKNEIKNLHKNSDDKQDEIDNLNDEIKNLHKSNDNKQEEINNLNDEIENLKIEIINLKQKMESTDNSNQENSVNNKSNDDSQDNEIKNIDDDDDKEESSKKM